MLSILVFPTQVREKHILSQEEVSQCAGAILFVLQRIQVKKKKGSPIT